MPSDVGKLFGPWLRSFSKKLPANHFLIFSTDRSAPQSTEHDGYIPRGCHGTGQTERSGFFFVLIDKLAIIR
jgi:hypothetical protein